MILLGVALLGFLLVIVGLILWAKQAPEVEKEVGEKPEIPSGSQYDFAAEQERLRKQQQDSEKTAPAPEGIETGTAASIAGKAAQQDEAGTEKTDSADIEPPPKDRRLTGEVLVPTDKGTTQAAVANGISDETSATPTPASFNGAEPFGDASPSGRRLASKLTPTVTAPERADRRTGIDYLLAKGTNIPCTMQTKIVTSQPGFTRCIVSKDIYSANGKVLLLERGSKITGEQSAALLQGQARIFVLWNEAETPYGVRVALASPAAGQLGEAGVGAKVNYHFWQRFGGAVMISLIGDLGDYASNHRRSSDGQTFNFDNTSQSAQDMAAEALKNSINIPPTGYVNQGSRINVIVARDVDFSRVYERLEPDKMPLPSADETNIRQ